MKRQLRQSEIKTAMKLAKSEALDVFTHHKVRHETPDASQRKRILDAIDLWIALATGDQLRKMPKYLCDAAEMATKP